MKKLELLGLFFWIMGGLKSIGAVLVAVVGVLGGMGLLDPKDAIDDRVAGAVGCGMIAVCMALLGVGHIIVGTGLRRERRWSRTGGIIIGVIDIIFCCNAPLGTALGIYTLMVLMDSKLEMRG